MDITDFPAEDFNQAQECYDWRKMDECLYGFFQQHPGHSESELEYVCAKVCLVNRAYRAKLHLQVSEKDFAEHLCKIGWLNEAIRELNEYSDFSSESLAKVIEHHRRLVEMGREWANLESFCSKYLHFHCPGVVPIYDTRAWQSLKKYYPSRLKWNVPYYYGDFCNCFLEFYQWAQVAIPGKVSVKSLDVFLYISGESDRK
jgi:hypothetical protein